MPLPAADLIAGAGVTPGTEDIPPTPPPMFLFTPPSVRVQGVVNGTFGLVYGWDMSQSVWKDAAGVWHVQQTPRTEDVIVASAYFNAPTLVDQDTADELTAAGIGTVTSVS
jgi:hypothetical protein